MTEKTPTDSHKQIVEGNLITLALQGYFDVIVHGCNCFCTMGAGIAHTIQKQFPEAFAADLMTNKGDRNKLGFFSTATVTENAYNITIVNGYTQFHHSGPPPLVDYDAVENLFRRIQKEFTGKRIGYPKIGAGLAGGEWSRIEKIIDTELSGEHHPGQLSAVIELSSHSPHTLLKEKVVLRYVN